VRAPLVAAAVALLLYVPTLAPGLTWRAGGDDAGDLITAAWGWGIPHSTGYPLYTLLGHLLLLIPWGDPAWRMNLLSALLAAGGVALVAQAVIEQARQAGHDAATADLAGVATGVLVAAAPLLWTQATITEVYTPLVAGGAAALLLARRAVAHLREGERTGPPLLGLAFVSGLGLTHHLSMLLPLLVAWGYVFWAWADLLVPSAVAVSPFLRAQAMPPERVPGRVWQPLAAFLAGLAPWLLLPLRAGTTPQADWHHPDTWAGFWALVSGSDYGGLLFHAPPLEMAGRAGIAALLLTAGAFGPAILFAGGGWRRAWRQDRAWAIPSALGLLAAIIMAGVYVADNTYVYGLAVLPVVALWLGAGLGDWLAAGLSRPRLVGLGALLTASFALGAAGWAWSVSADRTADGLPAADAFLARIDALPPRAVVLTTEDRETFTLWYARYVTARRADLLPLSVQLLGASWYRASLATHHADFAPALAGDPDFATLLARAGITRPILALRGDLAAPSGHQWTPQPDGTWLLTIP
jgi:hypothetical protein